MSTGKVPLMFWSVPANSRMVFSLDEAVKVLSKYEHLQLSHLRAGNRAGRLRSAL
jgi:hypothetical protein